MQYWLRSVKSVREVWIVLYTVHFTAFCLGGRFFPDTVYFYNIRWFFRCFSHLSS